MPAVDANLDDNVVVETASKEMGESGRRVRFFAGGGLSSRKGVVEVRGEVGDGSATSEEYVELAIVAKKWKIV